MHFLIRNLSSCAAIISLALLTTLAPLPACTEALAYMDTERSHKLDAPSCALPTMSSEKFFTKPASQG